MVLSDYIEAFTIRIAVLLSVVHKNAENFACVHASRTIGVCPFAESTAFVYVLLRHLLPDSYTFQWDPFLSPPQRNACKTRTTLTDTCWTYLTNNTHAVVTFCLCPVRILRQTYTHHPHFKIFQSLLRDVARAPLLFISRLLCIDERNLWRTRFVTCQSNLIRAIPFGPARVTFQVNRKSLRAGVLCTCFSLILLYPRHSYIKWNIDYWLFKQKSFSLRLTSRLENFLS